MSKTTKEVSIESLKYAAKLNNYRWIIAMTAIVCLVSGIILGYFASIELTSAAQAKVVNSITLKADQ